jgi:CubicO group peptidase (beta-lactamase class C family)
VVSDYHTATIDGRPFDFRSSTVGSGGMYSTVDDLYALATNRVLPLPFALMATSPRTTTPADLAVPTSIGHGYGWFVSRRAHRTVVWNSGDFAGHHSAILCVPDAGLVVIVLTSAEDRDATEMARVIVDRALTPKPTP